MHIWNHNKLRPNLVFFLFSKSFFILPSLDDVSLIYRSAPEKSFEWGTDSVISVRFNPGQPNVLATTATYGISIIMFLCACCLVILVQREMGMIKGSYSSIS